MDTSIDEDNLPQAVRPPVVAPPDPVLEIEPDDGLITYMALKDEDEELAKRACQELHRRHARLLWGWCLKNRAETFGDSAEAFVNAAFIKAYESAHTYTPQSGVSAEVRRRQVIRWLFRLLHNTFLDGRRAEMREPFLRSDDTNDGLLFDWPQPAEIESLSDISARRKNLVLNFIEQQDATDQAILKVTAQYWSASAKKTVMPEHVRKAVCRELGLTENSLRVRRTRALDRLKDFILQNEKQTTSTQ